MTTKESEGDKLDTIIEILQIMNKRDRLRMLGGFLKGVISLIPVIIVLWSAWYFYAHGEDLMMKITGYATEQAASMTQQHGGELMEQIKLMFPNATQQQ